MFHLSAKLFALDTLSLALALSSFFAEAAEDFLHLGVAFAFVAVAGLFLTPEPVHGSNKKAGVWITNAETHPM